MESRTVYIGENENIFERLDQENLEFDKKSRRNLHEIAKKSNNNLIGYYQFSTPDYYCKVYVLPKLLSETLPALEKQERFVEFLKRYYRIKIKFGDKVSTKQIDGNITDISLDSATLDSSMQVEDFLYLKYLDALQIVKRFFQRHKRLKYVNRAYSSQSIRHRIDLESNIRSLDKSIVHQIKKEPVAYSRLASISLSVLKAFKRNKLGSAEADSDLGGKLVSLTTSNINVLQKRFLIDKKFTITLRELIAHKTVKLFAKNAEHKALYQSLLILAGMEHFGRGAQQGTVQKIDNMISIFFNPSDLYEWIVYERLESEYPGIVEKDGLETGTEKTYYLRNNHGVKAVKKSKPDFIIRHGQNSDVVVDAKWKIPVSFEQIHYEDVTKLKRDCRLRKLEKAVLIYPSLPDGYQGEWYFDDDTSFTFQLQECGISHSKVVEEQENEMEEVIKNEPTSKVEYINNVLDNELMVAEKSIEYNGETI